MFTKKQYRGVGSPKKGEGFGKFVELSGGVGKKEWGGDFKEEG